MKTFNALVALILLTVYSAVTRAEQAPAEQWLLMLPLDAAHTDVDHATFYERARRDGPPARIRRTAVMLAQDYGFILRDHWPMSLLGLYCLVIEPSLDAGRLTELDADPRVAWAQPVQRYRTLGSARTDPYRPLQHGLVALDIAAAHRYARGRGVSVAVIDSGVDRHHPDLVRNVAETVDFVAGNDAVAEVHGTAVAGIIAAAADNGVGITGVAPDARLYALRACWPRTPHATAAICDSFTLAKALHYAVARAVQVINLSLAGPQDRLLRELIEVAVARGIALIAAVASDAAFPAGEPGVIAVAATEPKPQRSSSVRAPGLEVLSTVPGNSYDFFSGDSFAAAHVTGVVALLKEIAPDISLTEIRAALAAGVPATVNAERALAAIQP